MTTTADTGYGTLFKVRTATGPDVYTTIGEQTKFKGGGWSVNMVDASNSQSPGEVKEKIAGMSETKAWSVDINLVPNGSVVALLKSLRGVKSWGRIVYPDGSYDEGYGYFSDFDPDLPIDDKMVATIEFTLAGDFDSVDAAAPTNSVRPAISASSLAEGATLTAFEGVWDHEPTSFTYQWKNAGVNINGATSKTYVLVSGDTGDAITVAVTGTNSAGSATATSAAVTAD